MKRVWFNNSGMTSSERISIYLLVAIIYSLSLGSLEYLLYLIHLIKIEKLKIFKL